MQNISNRFVFWLICYRKIKNFICYIFKFSYTSSNSFITHHCMTALLITFKMASVNEVCFKQIVLKFFKAENKAVTDIYICLQNNYQWRAMDKNTAIIRKRKKGTVWFPTLRPATHNCDSCDTSTCGGIHQWCIYENQITCCSTWHGFRQCRHNCPSVRVFKCLYSLSGLKPNINKEQRLVCAEKLVRYDADFLLNIITGNGWYVSS